VPGKLRFHDYPQTGSRPADCAQPGCSRGMSLHSVDSRPPPRTRDEAALVVEGGPDSGASIPLPSGTTTLGRQSDNDVVVDEAAASRRHAAIRQTGGSCYLADLDSKNGTFVNRQRIPGEYLLKHGDIIHLGGASVSLVFRHYGGVTVDLPAGQAGPIVPPRLGRA